MKAGQVFNVAVKSAIEDWADQKLQGNELKKTISNWDHATSRRDTEREEELRAAHSSTFDLRCQLHAQRERFENIQFETQCIIAEFEKLRDLDESSEAYRQGVISLHKKLDAQITNKEKLFSLIIDDPASPSLASDCGLLEELRRNWVVKTGADPNGSQPGVFSQRSNAPSPKKQPETPKPDNNMQLVLKAPRQPQPCAPAYPGSSKAHPKTPVAQEGQPGAKPLAASAPQNKNDPFKTPVPDSRRRPVRNLHIRPNLGSPVGSGALVVPSTLESPFDGPDGRPFPPPPQRMEPSFRFPGTPNHLPQAVRPANLQGREGRGRGSRVVTPQPQPMMAPRPPTVFRPQAVEFRPTFKRGMAGPNVMGGPGKPNTPHIPPNNFGGSFRARQKNNAGTLGRGLARGAFQAATIAGSSSRPRVGIEGLDSAFLIQVEKAIDEFYQLTRTWVTDYAGSPDARQALTIKESPVWPAIVACYLPLTPLEANAYVDIHIRDPFYRPCLISRLIVDFFIARVWNVFAWMGFDEQSERGLVQLRDDFQRLGPQPAFQRQLLLERQCDIVTRITNSPKYPAFRSARTAAINAELAALLEPLVNHYAPRDRMLSELRRLAEQGWEVARLMAVGRTHFDFQFPHTGDRFSASSMRPVFPDRPGQQLQAEHWRVSLVVSPSVTCIRDNGGRIRVHDLFLADVVCMQ
ncbi:hypothetical protein VUR80DRAFT_5769 [Thermomyces stellatus]